MCASSSWQRGPSIWRSARDANAGLNTGRDWSKGSIGLRDYRKGNLSMKVKIRHSGAIASQFDVILSGKVTDLSRKRLGTSFYAPKQ